MTVIVIGAMLAALAATILIRPLARAGQRRHAVAVALLVPLAAIGLYLLLGHPDQPSASALFETTGPRAERRALTAQELTVMQALSEQPGNLMLMRTLGDIQMKAGRIDEAVKILEHARAQAPADHDVLAELGAAYYANAIRALMDADKAGALPWLEKADSTAPQDVTYRARLEADLRAAR